MQKRNLMLAALFAGGVLAGLASSEVIHAQVSGYATKQVLKVDLQNLPGQEALFFTSDWPPGYRLPWHKHEEGHEFVYVIEGELACTRFG